MRKEKNSSKGLAFLDDLYGIRSVATQYFISPLGSLSQSKGIFNPLEKMPSWEKMTKVLMATIIPKADLLDSSKLGLSWLPESTLEKLAAMKQTLLIFNSQKMTLQFHEIQNDVIHIVITFSRFSAKLISTMLHHLKDVTTKIMYSKGTNYDNEYIWEGFTSVTDLQRPIGDLPAIMQHMNNVVNIDWELISLPS